MIIGHQPILKFLKKSVETKRLAHAYLFAGPECLGKRTVALEFIRMFNGQEIDQAVHPDILIVEPESVEKEGMKKELEIGIDQVKQIQYQMSLFPYQAPYKTVLIDQAERMTAEASNCLLKTLEEPPGRAILILITARPQLLLPTIVSRCQLIKFLPVGEEEMKKKVSDPQIIRLANGRPGLAVQYLKEPALLQEQDKIINQLTRLIQSDLNEGYQYVENMAKDIPRARKILKYWLFWFRDLLLLALGCPDLMIYPEAKQYQGYYSSSKLKDIIQAIIETDSLLANPSINHRLALEVLILKVVK